MNLNVILLAIIGTVLSDDTCTYINQNKNLVSHSVTTVSQPTSPGLTEEVTIKVGESITIRYVNLVSYFSFPEHLKFFELDIYVSILI